MSRKRPAISSKLFQTIRLFDIIRPAAIGARVPIPEEPDETAHRATLCEQMRCHRLVMAGMPTRAQIRKRYEALSDDEKNRDWMPFNSMLKLIRRFDGLRIYRFDGGSETE